MKILSSRYVQIGLALIVAVLLITSFSSSVGATGPVYHTVEYGQTLYRIAMHYGTSVWAIACANGLYNPNYVYAGQVLVIPGGYQDGCKPGYKPGYQPDHQQSYDHQPNYGCGQCDGQVSYPKPNDGCGQCGQPQVWDNKGGCGYCGQPQQTWDNKGGCGYCDGQQANYHPYPQPKPMGCFYTVRWGDHLYRIALKYGVSWTVIAQANGLSNGNYIYAGQVLRVPCVY
jgi:LysM repeat protein